VLGGNNLQELPAGIFTLN